MKFDVHNLKLRHLAPRVAQLTTLGAVEVLDNEEDKIDFIDIHKGEETVWEGCIKFHDNPVAVLFEFNDLGILLRHMAATCEFDNEDVVMVGVRMPQ